MTAMTAHTDNDEYPMGEVLDATVIDQLRIAGPRRPLATSQELAELRAALSVQAAEMRARALPAGVDPLDDNFYPRHVPESL